MWFSGQDVPNLQHFGTSQFDFLAFVKVAKVFVGEAGDWNVRKQRFWLVNRRRRCKHGTQVWLSDTLNFRINTPLSIWGPFYTPVGKPFKFIDKHLCPVFALVPSVHLQKLRFRTFQCPPLHSQTLWQPWQTQESQIVKSQNVANLGHLVQLNHQIWVFRYAFEWMGT